MTKKVSELMLGEYVIGQLLQDNNMPDTPTARVIYRKMLERDGPWVGLTDEEYQQILIQHDGAGLLAFYNLVEAKLKEKNA